MKKIWSVLRAPHSTNWCQITFLSVLWHIPHFRHQQTCKCTSKARCHHGIMKNKVAIILRKLGKTAAHVFAAIYPASDYERIVKMGWKQRISISMANKSKPFEYRPQSERHTTITATWVKRHHPGKNRKHVRFRRPDRSNSLRLNTASNGPVWFEEATNSRLSVMFARKSSASRIWGRPVSGLLFMF